MPYLKYLKSTRIFELKFMPSLWTMEIFLIGLISWIILQNCWFCRCDLYRWSIIIAGRAIKKELGQDVVDSKQKLIQKLHKKIENVNIPEYARKVFDEEIAKLNHLEQNAEFNVVRNYLEWITDIPWGKQTIANFDIEFA